MLLTVLLFVSIATFSQYDFREGFVVTKSMDTIMGLIDYTGPDMRSRTCVFKKENDDQIVRYGADDLNSYYVSNKIFLGRK